MSSRNEVVGGNYEGRQIVQSFGKVLISTSAFKSIPLDKTTVKEYEILDEDSSKSVTSAVGRAFLGSVLIGPAGLLAGLSAKNKSTHMIALEFKDGKKSLIQLNKKAFSIFMKKIF